MSWFLGGCFQALTHQFSPIKRKTGCILLVMSIPSNITIKYHKIKLLNLKLLTSYIVDCTSWKKHPIIRTPFLLVLPPGIFFYIHITLSEFFLAKMKDILNILKWLQRRLDTTFLSAAKLWRFHQRKLEFFIKLGRNGSWVSNKHEETTRNRGGHRKIKTCPHESVVVPGNFHSFWVPRGKVDALCAVGIGIGWPWRFFCDFTGFSHKLMEAKEVTGNPFIPFDKASDNMHLITSRSTLRSFKHGSLKNPPSIDNFPM